MDLLGFEVEAQTPTAADLALDAGGWFAGVFGVVPRLAALVGDLDAAIAELAGQRIAIEPVILDRDDEGEADVPRAVRLTGPAGIQVDVVQPTTAAVYEERITGFIDSAADLEGPPTQELAAEVLAIVAAAHRDIEARLHGVAHNKVLATHLLLSQQSRNEPPVSPGYWQHSAASTLLSHFIVPREETT